MKKYIDTYRHNKPLQNALNEGFLFLEHLDFSQAYTSFNNILQIDSSCALAYLGVFCVQKNIATKEELYQLNHIDLKNKYYDLTYEYGDNDLKKLLDNVHSNTIYKIARAIKDDPKSKLDNYQYAVELLYSIPDYKDDAILLAELQEHIHNINDKRNKLGKKVVSIVFGGCTLVLIVVFATLGYNQFIKFPLHYKVGTEYFEVGDYANAMKEYMYANEYKDSNEQQMISSYNKAIELYNSGEYTNSIRYFAGAQGYKDSQDYYFDLTAYPVVHLYGIKEDGTIYTSNAKQAEDKFYEFKNIIKLAATDAGYAVVGIKEDGSTIASFYTNNNITRTFDSQSHEWTDMIQIAVAEYYMVGLKSDGTLLYHGSDSNPNLIKQIKKQKDVAQVEVLSDSVMLLKYDGTVEILYADNSGSKYDISDWEDIAQISYSQMCLGLTKDGQVVSADPFKKMPLSDTKIVDIAAYGNVITLDENGDIIYYKTYNTLHERTSDGVSSFATFANGSIREYNNYIDEINNEIFNLTDVVSIDIGDSYFAVVCADGSFYFTNFLMAYELEVDQRFQEPWADLKISDGLKKKVGVTS